MPAHDVAALHVGNLSIGFNGLSVSVATWSIAGSALVLLAVFLGRTATQWWRTRKQDHGIVTAIHAQVDMFRQRYGAWPATSAYLRDRWAADPAFIPFSTRTSSVDRPFERHRDRLPTILRLPLYRIAVAFYEDDRHFDDARAAVFDPAFRAISVDRRLNWLAYLDELAAQQEGRCAAILQGIQADFRFIGATTPSTPVGATRTQPAPAGASHDRKNGAD